MNLFLEMTINMFPETILSEKFHLLLLEEITGDHNQLLATFGKPYPVSLIQDDFNPSGMLTLFARRKKKISISTYNGRRNN